MNIKIELMAFIRRPEGLPRIFERKLDKSLTISQFLKGLGFKMDEIRLMQCFISKITNKDNNERVQRSYALKDGDYLFITLPIGGGI